MMKETSLRQTFRRHSLRYLVATLLALHGAACGPMTYTTQRTVFEPYSPKETKQSRGGITIERQKVVDLPPEFRAPAAKCNSINGQPMLDFQGRPMMEQVSLVPSHAIVEKLSIQNNTGHIVRLQGAVIAMFDPADNQYDHLDRDQIASMLGQEHPCASPISFKQSLMLVKLIDRNTELLPSRSVSGYLMFNPAQTTMPGIWKLSLYEIPTQTNAAGNVSQTVQFDFRTQATQYVDTYRKESPIDPPVLVNTQKAQ